MKKKQIPDCFITTPIFTLDRVKRDLEVGDLPLIILLYQFWLRRNDIEDKAVPFPYRKEF